MILPCDCPSPAHCLEATGGEQGLTADELEIARLRRELAEARAENERLRRERYEIARAFAQSEKHLENSRDSLATIIDEAFGPQEVLLTMSDLLSRLESLLNAQISKHQTALKERDEARAEVAALKQRLEASWRERGEATSSEREQREALARCRTASQILIAEIGASGPENVEEVARRAVVRIKEDDKVFLTMERADDHRRELEDELAAERQKRADALADLAEVDVALRNLVNSVEATKTRDTIVLRDIGDALKVLRDKRERALVELARNGCDCECDCVSQYEDHNEDCEPCLACRIAAILEDQS